MLRGIHKATSNWLGKAILMVIMGLLVVSFAVWGIGDIFRGFGRNAVAKVGDTEISIEQFRQYYTDGLQRFGRQLGRPITPDQARGLGLDRQLLSQLVAETTLDAHAHKLRLGLANADRAHPELAIVLNGGIASLQQAQEQLAHVDGVMMGRAAYQEPWQLLGVDPLLFGEPATFDTPKAAALALMPYIEREISKGVRLHAITRHVLGLFHAVPGARAFRRHLATQAVKPGAGAAVMADALAQVLDTAKKFANIAA